MVLNVGHCRFIFMTYLNYFFSEREEAEARARELELQRAKEEREKREREELEAKRIEEEQARAVIEQVFSVTSLTHFMPFSFYTP